MSMLNPDHRLPEQAEPFLVGGAVRDRLLGVEEKDRDWLVIGVSAKQMLEAGFHQVGRDFAVFLHPESHEEYALPRGDANKSNLPGADAEIAADLCRRDLTINALAMAADGRIIDPCGGVQDIQQRVLRHTPHFAQDSLRTLRLVRFYARFHHLGFRIHDETLRMAQDIAASGVLADLPPERVWREIKGGLSGLSPEIFIREMREIGLLKAILPEVEALFGVPQPEKHHPEIDTGEHILLALQAAARISENPSVRFAVLMHDLGKGITPEKEWPRHVGHEEAGVKLVKAVCQRLRVPNEVADLAVNSCRFHLLVHRCFELKPRTLLKLFNGLGGLRQPAHFRQFLQVCEADSRGRLGLHDRAYPQADFLAGMLDALLELDGGAIAKGCDDPTMIAEKIRRERLKIIAAKRKSYS